MIYVLPNFFIAKMLCTDFRKVLGRSLRQDRKGFLSNIFREVDFYEFFSQYTSILRLIPNLEALAIFKQT